MVELGPSGGEGYGICAICLDVICLQEIAIIKDCEHVYWFVSNSFFLITNFVTRFPQMYSVSFPKIVAIFFLIFDSIDGALVCVTVTPKKFGMSYRKNENKTLF